MPNSKIKEKILAIGSSFTDESGARQVPVYVKEPNTGLMKTKLVNVGKSKQIKDQNNKKE